LPAGLLLLPQGSFDGPRLWTSDGTAAGTVPLSVPGFLGVNTYSAQLSVVANLAYFLASGDGGRQLWRSDGTAAGTVRLTDEAGGISFLFELDPWPWQGGVLFSFGDRLWASDGTPSGTGPLFDGLFENGVHYLKILHADPERVYFIDESELWVSDGTRAGSHRLPGVRVFGGSAPAVLATDDKLFFRGIGSSEYPQLWALDKASERVERLTRWAGVPAFDLDWLAGRVGENLLLPADDGIHGLEPWISDGTPEGTRLLADLAAGTDGLASCVPEDRVLCLQHGRLRVTVDWHEPRHGLDGVGHAIAAGGAVRTGYFWFFAADNVELAVKLLDGGRINGHYWTFYGGLTDVEYDLLVVDLVSGEHRRYHNPAGEICGAGDTRSLPASAAATSAAGAPDATPAGTGEGKRSGRMAFPGPIARAGVLSQAAETCVADGHTLCLLGGRFRARVRWHDQHNGGSGEAGAVRFSDRSGLFSFFHPENVELVVKALDGRDVNGHSWIFFASLTDVGYTLTVEDLADGGAVRRYVNPPGEICGRGDTAAFP
jgi:ELWxxDGT repeat protein